MAQQFYAHPTNTFTWANGAVGHRPGGAFDTIGPLAKVHNCPVVGTGLRRTCYATGHADTAFSVPACTRIGGKYVKGYFSTDSDGNIEFRVVNRYRRRAGLPVVETQQCATGWAVLENGKPLHDTPFGSEWAAATFGEWLGHAVIATDEPAHSSNKGQA